MEIPVVRNILEANSATAEELRTLFAQKKILVLNLISSPGAGKTTLLERTLAALAPKYGLAVIEGDLMTDNDARRVAATGAQAVQINTEGGCHLDAAMVSNALVSLNLDTVDILFVENVGNLVCPVEFDVGEDAKIAVLSVTEGDDKPEKYPLLFELSKAMVLNKMDLLPYVDFDPDRAEAFARSLNKGLVSFRVSCRQPQGLDAWYEWIENALAEKQRLAVILDSIADGVFTVDLDWNVTFFNRSAETITGIPRAEAVGRKCWEVFHSSLCDGSCALEHCMNEDVRLSGKSIFIIRPDGERTPISISAAPLRDAAGNLVGGVETFRDLTEIVRLRRE
ncbi:MAG: hydrogenase nickel incorporation protein HypB, partial [Oceanidesulfovibrio sp.]